MAKIKAPSINEIKIDKLSANYIQFSWDDVGRNFYYLIEMKEFFKDGNDSGWNHIGHSDRPQYTIGGLTAQTEYQIRVSVSSRGFEQSDWTYTDKIKSFLFNLYTFSVMNELTLADKFIEEKFTNDNKGYVNFNNDVVMASLMDNTFKFAPNISHISYIRDQILKRKEYHEVLGEVSKICRDINRVMPGYIDDVMYIVERYQKVAKVSNDKGQSWQTIELFDGRVGDPISNVIFTQNETTTFALGYDHIFSGRPSSNIRWSSIRERFSQVDVSFTRLDDQLNLGYEIEVFNKYAKIPNELDGGKVEAFTTTDSKLFIAGNGTVRYLDIEDPLYDLDPSSPTFNQRLFEPDIIEIFDKDIVIKRMESVGDTVLLLVSGRLKDGKLDKRNPENITSCKSSGVYRINSDFSVERVFGEAEEERYYIEHEYTDLSTNGREFFINYANFDNHEYFDSNETVEENGQTIGYIEANNKRYRGYHNSPKTLMGSYRCDVDNVDDWKRGYMKYYLEPTFTYMAREGNRAFITSQGRFGIVHGEENYTYAIETEGPGSDDRILGETWSDGNVTIYSPNIKFIDFNLYASGVMLYKNTGEIIGFFEFPTSVINEVEIIWKPQNVLLSAELIGQTIDKEELIKPLNRPEDPNLVPFIRKIIPENYFRDSDIEESRYYKFIKLYLEYISEPRDSVYKSLVNIVRNQNPFEDDSLQYLWEEAYKRNIYLDRKKREETIRFFMSRQHDFYSAKGTIESYKFLFKLLYNEDVEIDNDTELMDYYFPAIMDNIDQDIIGKVIYTKTGRCYVTKIDRDYVDGIKVWNISITNMIGQFYKGQEILSEDGRYRGIIDGDIKGREWLFNDIDYINYGQSYYVMRIKSKLPVSRYRDDIIRFVHPLGVDFKGVVDITMFMNAGINFKHMQTEINKRYAYKFDSGIPTHYPDRRRVFDAEGNSQYDDYTGYVLYEKHPRHGDEMVIDEDQYNNENNNVILDGLSETIKEYIKETTPNDRRRRYSPLFDSSGVSFSQFMDMTNSFIENSYQYRLKDNVGLPRDPDKPTQAKLNEELKNESSSLL